MARRYFLKAIGASDRLLTEHWLEDRPELLRTVRNPKRPQGISTGDQLVYYATGHQKLIGIARATESGSEAEMDLAGDERFPYVLRVQVQLAIPTLKLAPSWDVLEIPSTSIMKKPYIELNDAQYERAWQAIVERTKP